MKAMMVFGGMNLANLCMFQLVTSRHAYCPLSWSLARDGKTGRGKAIDKGRIKHAEIHQKVENFKLKQNDLRRALIIWSWWFTMVVMFVTDAIIFTNISDRTPIDISRICRFYPWLVNCWPSCDLSSLEKVEFTNRKIS